jgi:hypothetical protein
MEVPSTPRLIGTRNADFTRPLDPSSPHIGDRLSKRSQTEHITAPGPLPYGGKTRKTTTAAVALQEGIEASISEATRTAEILKDFATRTDTFASGYKSQKDQRIAEAVSNAVARALVAFYQESFAPTRSPSPPQTPHALSYASVAKSSKNNETGAPKGQAAPKKGPTKPTQTSREDYRVLVTLPSASLLGAREEAYLLRRRLVEKVNSLTMAKIPAISPTMTGWALFPSDLATRDLLLTEPNQAAVLEALGGCKVSVPEVWFDYVVPLIPAAFHGISGEILVTRDLMLEEAFNQTGETPVRCDISRHGANPITGKASWIISFKKKVRPFHIFNTWSHARLIDKKPRITRHAIGGCQGWCNPVKCTRAPLCGHCGSKIEGHDGPTGENCQHGAKCANCWGPYKASHDNCPARPTTKNGRIVRPTKAETRRIRQAGRQAALAAAAGSTSRSTSTSLSSTGRANPDLTSTSPSPSPTPPLQLQGTKRRNGARITEYENARSQSTPTPASPSVPTSGASSSSSRPARSTANQQNLNVKLLSRNSLQGNSFAPLRESTTTSIEPGFSDDEMDGVTQ